MRCRIRQIPLSWSADADLAAGLFSLHELAPGIEQDRLVVGLADAAIRWNSTAALRCAGKR